MKKYSEAIMETIIEQIEFGKPLFVKEGYENLLERHSNEEAKEIMASALAEYIYEIMNNSLTYNENGYREKVNEILEREKTWKKQM